MNPLETSAPDFPLGRPSSQTERFTCFIILRCILEGFTRYYYIVACTCQHSPVTLLHRSDFPNALTVEITVRIHVWNVEAFWKIACSEFGLRDRFCPVFLGVEKSDNFNLFQLHSNSKTKLIGNFFSERIDSKF